jgi:hypothetical protein
MSLLMKKRVLAAKIETTIGTAIALGNADGAENVFNAKLVPNVTVEERPGQGGFGRLGGVPGARTGTATFRTYIYYDGTTVPFWATTFLPACGWVATGGVYTPRSEAPGSNVKTLTIGCYADGKLYSIAGAMGTFQAVFPNGRPAYIDWTFTGKWQAVTNTALITPTYPTTLPMRYASATTTFNSVALCLEQVTLDAGNTVTPRECTADATGYHSYIVTDRYPKITANPEAVAIATRDPHAQLLAGTEAAFALSIPTTGGGYVGFDAPKAQLLSVGDEDRSGLMVDALEFGCNKNGSTHDQELSITFDAD